MCLQVQGLDFGQEPVELRTADEPAIGDDSEDSLRIADVLKRVGVEQHKICELGVPVATERKTTLSANH